MPFYRLDFGDRQSGGAHLNFGRKPGPRHCVASALDFDDQALFGGKCARVAVALCDAPVSPDLTGAPLTCSAAMCVHHRTSAGADVDYCFRHKHLAPSELPL